MNSLAALTNGGSLLDGLQDSAGPIIIVIITRIIILAFSIIKRTFANNGHFVVSTGRFDGLQGGISLFKFGEKLLHLLHHDPHINLLIFSL